MFPRIPGVSLLACCVVLISCGRDGAEPGADRQVEAVISDQAHDDSVQGFFFLPPMVSMPELEGTFAAGLSPVVRIDEMNLEATTVLRQIALFTTTTGPGSETVREGDHHYIVNWHTDEFGLDPDLLYRIRVLVGDHQVGFADVDVVESGRELRHVASDEFIPLLDGRTLPIKFFLNLCGPLVCEAADQCHIAGECDPDTGECSSPAAPDGTSCDDSDLCTSTDSCVDGVCTGDDPVICEAADQCHVAGECNPDTGECSGPAAPDGTGCDDGDVCTEGDVCESGICAAMSITDCDDGDGCTIDSCEPDVGCQNDPDPACACPPSLELCGGECVDILGDTANCGVCGNDCGPGGECFDGVCMVMPPDCIPGEVLLCGIDRGECIPGEVTCDPDGYFGPCEGAIGPSPEVCDDGLDNDCDGVVDEGCGADTCADAEELVLEPITYEGRELEWARVTGNTEVRSNEFGPAACAGGDGPEAAYFFETTRRAVISADTFGPGTDFDTVLYVRADDCESGPEVGCNDDFDGLQSMTSFVHDPGLFYVFVDGWGEDSAGDFELTIVVQDVCVPGDTMACGSDVGTCESGLQTCLPEEVWGPCEGAVGPGPELCDGLDNNCNGLVDDSCGDLDCGDGLCLPPEDEVSCPIDCGFMPPADCVPDETAPCGLDVGECLPGMMTCSPVGYWGPCDGAVGPGPELCDDLDNDCDGLVDEGAACLGGSATTFEAVVTSADVLFLIDTTGSMGGELDNVKTSMSSTIVPSVMHDIPDVAFGVAHYEDFPVGPYGSGTNVPYGLTHRITTDIDSFTAALYGLETFSGGDGPESALEALFQAATGAGFRSPEGDVWVPPVDFSGSADPDLGYGSLGGVGFREGAMPIIVLATDAPFHVSWTDSVWINFGMDPPYQPEYFGSDPDQRPTNGDEVMAALEALGAIVIGISTNDERAYTYLAQTAVRTGAWMEPIDGLCPTGTPDEPRFPEFFDLDGPLGPEPNRELCPLVYPAQDTGVGVGMQVANAISDLVSYARYSSLHVEARDNPATPGVDESLFLFAAVPLESDPATCDPMPETSDLFSGPSADPGSDGIEDSFIEVPRGCLLTFDIIVDELIVPPECDEQTFSMELVLIGDGATEVSREIFAVTVPADPALCLP